MANSITKIYKNGVEYDIYASWGASVNTASATTAWVVKLGSDIVQTRAANNPSSTSWKTYPIQVNNGWQMVVNVPWENTQAVSSVNWQTWAVTVQDTLESGTNIKTVNNESILGSWNIAISWWHDYSWNTLTGTSFTLSWTNYRNLISTSSDTTVSVWTDLTPWMEYIIRITNTDSDNDHTMTFNWVEYIIPKSWTVTYKWLALTATTVEFEWPRYVYSMPATPEEWFIYYVLPEPEHPREPTADCIVYYKFQDDMKDYSWNWFDITSTAWSAAITTLSWIKCLNLDTSWSYVYRNLPTWMATGWSARTHLAWVRWSELWEHPVRWYGSGSYNAGDSLWNNNESSTWPAWTQYWNWITSSQWISVNTWYLMWVTVSNGTVKLYINWQLVGTKSMAVNTSSWNPLYLGKNPWSNATLVWYLWAFASFNTAWADADIADYYNKTKSNYWL